MNFPQDRIVCLEPPTASFHNQSAEFQTKKNASNKASTLGRTGVTVQYLIERGLSDLNIAGPKFVERHLKPGEGKTKLAFLSFSSGTTGNPKVTLSNICSWFRRTLTVMCVQAVAIPHYAPISNVLQTAAFWRFNDPTVPFEERRCRDGDVSLSALPMFRTCPIYSLYFSCH